jgi:cell wall-associated NlpC family hydrolase
VRKSKSLNFSFLVLTLLFILSQTTFAITAGLSAENNSSESQQTGTPQIIEAFRDYDIDTNGNKIFATAAVLTNEKASETQATTLQAPAALAASTKVETTASAASAKAEAKPPVQEIKSVVRYVNADELNVREQANSSSKLVATVKKGDKVTYYETNGEWARIITWSDKKGYILAKYLVSSEKEVEKVATASAKSTKSTVSRSTSEKTSASKPASDEALSLTQKIINYAKSLQGIKYVYGGYSKSGFDCSGFTKYVFAKYDISLPRSSGSYYGIGTKVARSDIRAGDIVLFDTDGGTADVSHVGIYIGGGNFIHASTSKGRVIIMDLSSYRGKYMGARRVIN